MTIKSIVEKPHMINECSKNNIMYDYSFIRVHFDMWMRPLPLDHPSTPTALPSTSPSPSICIRFVRWIGSMAFTSSCIPHEMTAGGTDLGGLHCSVTVSRS